jgi:hypothetical protein
MRAFAFLVGDLCRVFSKGHVSFGCRHTRVTRPITPRSKIAGQSSRIYVVCLIDGTELDYALTVIRIASPRSTWPRKPPAHDRRVIAALVSYATNYRAE